MYRALAVQAVARRKPASGGPALPVLTGPTPADCALKHEKA